MRRIAKLFMLLLALLLALALAACGGGSNSSSTSSTTTSGGVITIPGPVEAQQAPVRRPVASQVAGACPPGKSRMGCSQRAIPNLHRGPQLAIPNVPLFPDVSSYQGNVGWGSVAAWQRSHGWHPLAIWKLGEYHVDPYARRNASETARLGFFRAGYWFVRNTGCAREADQMIAEGRAEGLHVLVEDNETSESRGYAACLTPRLTAAGFVVIEYSSPGSNPDGGRNPGVKYLWVAAYGPSHVPCLFTCTVGDLSRQSIVAWQLTDGTYGFVVNIPGIGRDDVSADYGLSRLFAPPKPPPPRDPYGYHYLTAYERDLVLHYDGAQHQPKKYAAWIKTLEGRLSVQAHAVWVAAHKPPPAVPSWGDRNRGVRFQILIQRAQGKKVVP